MTRVLLAIIAIALLSMPAAAQTDQRVSGTIDALGEAVTLPILHSAGTLSIKTDGTWSGTLVAQCSIDGAFPGVAIIVREIVVGGTLSGSIVTSSSFAGAVAGCAAVRVVSTAWTSGSVDVDLRVSTASSQGPGPWPFVLYDNAQRELDFRQENENWNTADHGILVFGRDVESTPNKYRAIRLDDEGRLIAHLESDAHTFKVDFSNFDYDTGGATKNTTMWGIALPASGGPVAGGTATNPVRIDPTGTTTQPVSGTVTATVSGTVTANQGTAASAANRWPVYVSDGTNTMPTADAAARGLYARITDGTVNFTAGQKTSANSFPVVLPSDQTVSVSGSVTASGTVTSNQGTAAAAANRWPVYISNGTQAMPTMDDPARTGYVTESPASALVDGSTAADVGPAALPTNACKKILVQADPDNDDDVFIGASGSQNLQLQPGMTVTYELSNMNLIFIRAPSGNPVVNYQCR